VIEVVSAPRDLATWDHQRQPFYLEVFGETRPIVDMEYAQASTRFGASSVNATGDEHSPEASNETTGSARGAPIYE